jgi:hypothetical protein
LFFGLGAILLFQSGNVVLHYSELLSEAGATGTVTASAVSRGLTAEFLAGIAGIVLGLLALLRIVPMTLLLVAVITYGGTLMLTSGESLWLNSLVAKDNAIMRQLMHCMSVAAAGAQVLAGLAALVLGILALVTPMTPGPGAARHSLKGIDAGAFSPVSKSVQGSPSD